MNILITGANGYIGKEIYNFLSSSTNYNIYALTRQVCDLTNREDVDKFFKNKYFDIIIHTAK